VRRTLLISEQRQATSAMMPKLHAALLATLNPPTPALEPLLVQAMAMTPRGGPQDRQRVRHRLRKVAAAMLPLQLRSIYAWLSFTACMRWPCKLALLMLWMLYLLPLWLMVMKPSSMSMLGVPYSPMVPSFTRWQSAGRQSSLTSAYKATCSKLYAVAS